MSAQNRQPWTEADFAKLRKLHGQNMSPTAIGAMLGRTKAAVMYQISANGLVTRQATTTRSCMCCSTPFRSKGNHNRLCEKCRRIESTPFDY